MERDLIQVSLPLALKFQLTRSRGAWLEICEKAAKILDFNSHAHVERDDTACSAVSKTSNFNSHAHVERDALVKDTSLKIIISTHTLTWSVTYIENTAIEELPFQLTRSRGAWRQRGLLLLTIKDFNSHAHVERDPGDTESVEDKVDFNSHAHVERDQKDLKFQER